MLAANKGKLINEYRSDYIVLDLETTGLSPEKEDIIEISAVKVTGGSITGEFSTLVNPGRHIEYNISAITGIMDDMVEDSPDIKTALTGFLGFIGDTVLVGHNIRNFDLRFLYRDAMRFWGKTIGNDYIDTLILSRAYLPNLDHHGLADMAGYYGISTVGAHRALADCKMTQQVFENLHNEMLNPSPEAKAVKRCPYCGNLLKKRSGIYGEFYGCMSYPDCKYTQDC